MRTMAVDFFPRDGVRKRELVRRDANYLAVLGVEVMDFEFEAAAGDAEGVGEAACAVPEWTWILAERMEVDVVYNAADES